VPKRNARTVRSGPFDYADFCRLVGEKQKADLIDGVIYMASPENTDADSLFLWLVTVLELYVEARKLGRVFGSRVALRLDEKNAPEPDISFVRKSRLALVKRGGIEGAVDLAIEIVSPDSVERDYQKKFWQYQRAGVAEYWIVDEMLRTVTAYRLSPNGAYEAVLLKNGVLHSRAVTGFWIRPEWLWRHPRPNRLKILKQLLGSRG
jgi:Uma2 family endonuclease